LHITEAAFMSQCLDLIVYQPDSFFSADRRYLADISRASYRILQLRLFHQSGKRQPDLQPHHSITAGRNRCGV
jgi:hypothetical protein